MTIKPAILSFFALSLFLFSFSKPGTRSGIPSVKYLYAIPLSEMKSDTGGRTVRLDSIQSCIDRYVTVMSQHGFTNHAGDPVNIRIHTTRLVTTAESFNGKNLQDWLNATAASYAAAGKTLMIRIQLGIYDANYLNTYQPDPALRAANVNRIAIFVVPYDAATPNQSLSALAAPSGGGGGTGFDLGGVQP